jgi:hypothetical protein
VTQNRTQSFIVYFLLLVAIGVMLYVSLGQKTGAQEALTINEVADAIQSGSVARVTIEEDNTITVVYKSGQEGQSHKESDATLVTSWSALGPEQLTSDNVKIESNRRPSEPGYSAAFSIFSHGFHGHALVHFRQAQKQLRGHGIWQEPRAHVHGGAPNGNF